MVHGGHHFEWRGENAETKLPGVCVCVCRGGEYQYGFLAKGCQQLRQRGRPIEYRIFRELNH